MIQYCIEDGCTELAEYDRLEGMYEETPVFDRVCWKHIGGFA